MNGVRALRVASTTAILFAIAFGVLLTAAISWNRAFQVDEVEHIHAAYNMRDGRVIYRDFWQGHTPLLYVLLAPVIDPSDPIASFHRARVVSGLILIATVLLVVYCAKRLGGTTAALAAAPLMLFQTTMVERGMEVRPDGGLALCIVAALAIELRQRSSPLARFSAQALCLGAGFLFTQKAVFATIAFGCLWLLHAIRERRPRLVLQPALLWLAPLAAAMLVLLAFGSAREFFRQNIVDAFFAGAGAQYRGRFSPIPGLLLEGRRNVAFLLLGIAGVALLAKRRHFAAFLAIALAASLWANPFPWPYVHVAAIPLFAIAGAYAVGTVDRAFVAIAMALVMLTGVPRLLEKSAPSAGLQFATLHEIQRVTSKDDRVFDLVGLYFRPDAYPSAYAMSGELIRWYAQGGFPRMAPELRRNACAAVLMNYRTQSLGPEEREFFRGHYAHYWSTLFLAGRDLSREGAGDAIPFEVLKTRTFRYDGGGAITIDGMPFQRGTLRAGMHTITVARGSADARLITDTPPPVPPRLPPAALYVNFD